VKHSDLSLNTPLGIVSVVDEPAYTSWVSDNNLRTSGTYPFIKNLEPQYQPSSAHGVWVNGVPLALFAAGGGASGVHPRSCIYVDELIYLAVGDHVVCMRPFPFEYQWALQVDAATCFGVHFNEVHKAFIAHGELEITRFSPAGAIMWQSSGADIFSEACKLMPDYVEALDFNGLTYRFNYSDGRQYA
jgi:hypothetical protein